MPRPRLALLLVVLLLTGCLGVFDRRPPSDDRALELRDRFDDAVAETETYRFSSRIRVSASDGDVSRSATATGSGAVDRDHRLVRSVAESDGERRRSFVYNYTAYQRCVEPWDGWGVEELDTDRPWVEHTPLGRYRAILAESRVYSRGTETVDGARTAVVVAHPRKGTLEDVAGRPSGGSVGTSGLENATLTLWLDPETALPVRSELRLRVERGGATATGTVETSYADYGEAVNTTVPNSVHTHQYGLGCPGE